MILGTLIDVNTHGKNMVFYKAPSIWNTLDRKIKSAESINIFKTSIKL